MREALLALEGQRVRVRGVFRRLGRKQDFRGAEEGITVLLSPVLLPDGSLVSDHLWFNMTRGFAALDLRRGMVVELSARVARYKKLTHDWGRGTDDPISEDLKLVRPTGLRVVGREPEPGVPDPRADMLARVRAGEGATGVAIDAVLALLRAEQPPPAYGEVLIARGQLAIIQRALQDLRDMVARVPA